MSDLKEEEKNLPVEEKLAQKLNSLERQMDKANSRISFLTSRVDSLLAANHNLLTTIEEYIYEKENAVEIVDVVQTGKMPMLN